jgi:hypothetical protein
MTTPIGDALRLANSWKPGCGRWTELDAPAGVDRAEKLVWDGAKLLAIAQESGDVARIARERANVLHAGQGYIASRTPAAEAPTPSLGANLAHGFIYLLACIAALFAGFALGVAAGKFARSQTGGYVVRSVMRGFIYKGIGALGR